MKEKELLTKAKHMLTEHGGLAWSVRTGHDVFGIFDIIYLSPAGYTSYYQVSTSDHRWQRKYKIMAFRTKHGDLPPRSFLMLWNYAVNNFEFEKV
jgi:hypothetical protein